MKATFGPLLRGYRLRYVWISSRGYFMRTSEIKGGWLVELAPPVPSELKDKVKGPFRILPTEADALEVIQASPCLNAIKSVKKYFQIKLNDDGTVLA